MKKIFLILFFIKMTFSLFSYYPEIKTLNKSDTLFKQLQYEINEYYKRVQSRQKTIPISIYKYILKENDSIFSISARLNITYDSIVSINGIENPESLHKGTELLIPNSPGMYITKEPSGKMEELIALRKNPGFDIFIKKSNDLIPYIYLSGTHLNKMERSFFLKTLFQRPLGNSRITSSYGYRTHPINKIRHFHTGIDYRASIGTAVNSSREGIVSETGVLENYGLYIIMKHEGGYETVYSHLNKILVKINDKIASGQTIANSGNSGISTGPHLHFEIRKKGIPLNPYDFFSGEH